MVKQKKVQDIKTSEIINELYDFEDERRGDELDEELMSRYPFNYYWKIRFEEIEEELKKLKKLLTHHHKSGMVLYED